MSRKLFRILALSTLLGFGGSGIWLVYEFHELEALGLPSEIDFNLIFGIIGGAIYGYISAFVGWWIIQREFMSEVKSVYSKLIGDLQLSWWDVVGISLCAGIGEELFFRGGIQPWLGVWVTSVLFVAIHGYLNPVNWRISIYGLYMTAVIAGIGWAYDQYGIVFPAVAHTIVDVVLLSKLVKSKPG